MDEAIWREAVGPLFRAGGPALEDACQALRRRDSAQLQADAFDHMKNTLPQENCGTVFADLWHDVSDGLPLYRRMKALETPGPRYLYWIEPTLQCYL